MANEICPLKTKKNDMKIHFLNAFISLFSIIVKKLTMTFMESSAEYSFQKEKPLQLAELTRGPYGLSPMTH